MPLWDRFPRHVALPDEHGSWVLLLGPLIIGVAAAPGWTTASLYLVLAALFGFLARQPLTLAVKAYSGRRSRDVLPTAWSWIAIDATIAAIMLAALTLRGYGFVLVLALPAVPVLAWNLFLVARRAERRQQHLEVAASGVLALSATAAYWVGRGAPHPIGWWLWLLTWAQSATAIVYAYLRLAQRPLPAVPDLHVRWAMGRAALAWSCGSLVAVVALCAAGVLPRWLWVAFAVQAGECVYGVLRPAVQWKPRAIGWRQLAVSALFTLLFVAAWR